MVDMEVSIYEKSIRDFFGYKSSPLSTRVIYALEFAKIKTVGELIQYHKTELLKFSGIGINCVTLIENKLSEHYLHLNTVAEITQQKMEEAMKLLDKKFDNEVPQVDNTIKEDIPFKSTNYEKLWLELSKRTLEIVSDEDLISEINRRNLKFTIALTN